MTDESGSEEYEVVEETVVVETTETKQVEKINTVEVTIEGEGRQGESTKQVTGEIITEDITQKDKDKTGIEIDVERKIEIERRREGEKVQTETIKGEDGEDGVHIVTIEGRGSQRQNEARERQEGQETTVKVETEIVEERLYQYTGGYTITGQYTGVGYYDANGKLVGPARYNSQGQFNAKGAYDADGKYVGQWDPQQDRGGSQGKTFDDKSSSSYRKELTYD